LGSPALGGGAGLPNLDSSHVSVNPCDLTERELDRQATLDLAETNRELQRQHEKDRAVQMAHHTELLRQQSENEARNIQLQQNMADALISSKDVDQRRPEMQLLFYNIDKGASSMQRLRNLALRYRSVGICVFIRDTHRVSKAATEENHKAGRFFVSIEAIFHAEIQHKVYQGPGSGRKYDTLYPNKAGGVGINSSDARRAAGGRAKSAASRSQLSGSKPMEPTVLWR
jgi:hypothetical protein